MRHKIILKVGMFVLIFAILLIIVQNILQQKWYYPNWSWNTYKIVNDIYDLDDNSVDAVFIGTSHMESGVSPI